MHKGQEQFYNFLIERIQPDKQDEANALILDCFKKQSEGNFTAHEFTVFQDSIRTMLKPEHIEEVLSVFRESGEAHISK